MAERLQSLSNRGRRKFAPNLVNRRTQEERASTAPVIKPESTEQTPIPAPEPRRRPRGGIRAEAEGPLSAPASSVRTGRRGPTLIGRSSTGPTSRIDQPRHAPADRVAGEFVDICVSKPPSSDDFFPVQVHKEPVGVSDKTAELEEPENEQTAAAEPLDLLRHEMYLVSLSSLQLPSDEVAVIDADAMEITDFPTRDSKQESKPELEQIGSLHYHASGRVAAVIGTQVFELLRGTSPGSVEEVFNIADNRAEMWGTIKDHLVMVPDLNNAGGEAITVDSAAT